jgi:hypothetical protein
MQIHYFYYCTYLGGESTKGASPKRAVGFTITRETGYNKLIASNNARYRIPHTARRRTAVRIYAHARIMHE